VRPGPEATAEMNAKLEKIVQDVDPDMSPEVVNRLSKVLRILPGFKTKGKQGEYDREPQKIEKFYRDLYQLALSANVSETLDAD
jgi:hypothetical protein